MSVISTTTVISPKLSAEQNAGLESAYALAIELGGQATMIESRQAWTNMAHATSLERLAYNDALQAAVGSNCWNSMIALSRDIAASIQRFELANVAGVSA
jgi:hypothetical protein